jgi:hypothetical protein
VNLVLSETNSLLGRCENATDAAQDQLMDAPFRLFRTFADYTLGTLIVVAQLTLADRRRVTPALASGRR